MVKYFSGSNYRTNKPQLKMESARVSAETLQTQIATAKKQLKALKEQLAGLESPDKADNQPLQPREGGRLKELGNRESTTWPLTQEEYNRYGRQMIVPSIGIQGPSCKFYNPDHGIKVRQANCV
jgi:hypothetical protein